MFLEYQSLTSNGPISVDVCIIGAGIAGITLARRLEGSGLSVLLVESGGKRTEERTQALNEGTSSLVGYPFRKSRVRAFGGTSTTWTGACIPLDTLDFEDRSWLAHSGWPIGLDDLLPFYEASRTDFGIPTLDGYQANLNKSPFHGGDLESKAVAYSVPLDFGKRYGKLIELSRNVTCLLNTTVTEIFPDHAGKRVERIQLATFSGETIKAAARVVVLAGGGIENARLLLASNSVQTGGLGNNHDVVGRYHMEHPMRAVAVLPIGDRYQEVHAFTNRSRLGKTDVQGTFGLSRACRMREQLLDMHLRAYRYDRLEDSEPIIAAKSAASHMLGGERRFDRRVMTELFRALRPRTARYLAWHTTNKLRRNARFDHLRFTAFVEQEPDPNNRITLANEKDPLGKPLPHLNYQESALMADSIHRSLNIMGVALSASGFGKLRHGASAMGSLSQYDKYGLHQMGSTRMSDNPRQGVVDQNCQVHGLANLFVAGSSVFPTGGAANPTWTIAALSLRLADHLLSMMRETTLAHRL